MARYCSVCGRRLTRTTGSMGPVCRKRFFKSGRKKQLKIRNIFKNGPEQSQKTSTDTEEQEVGSGAS